MTTAAAARAALDRMLDEAGTPATLRRIASPSNLDCAVRAAVTYPAAEKVVDTVDARRAKIILSPTDLERAAWCAGQAATTTNPTPTLPAPNDRVLVDGRALTIEAPVNIRRIAGTVVRIELRAVG